ncbi:MAG: cytochrome C biogenesis protein, partial [Planctomycetes bacterium]|nr:cytochrome C biogenesis protein [Planctomycetota bacterium]
PAMVAAMGWGVMSILLSPCHLASIPLVVAYVNRGEIIKTKKAFMLSCLFSFGILISILAIGLLTALLGRMLGDIGPWGKWIVAAVFIVFGLVMLEVINLPWSGPNVAGNTKTGAWGALLLGLIFGAAVGPCTFAYMAPVLAVVLETAGTHFVFAATLILLYSIGHCGIIVLAGTLGARIQTFLNWDQKAHVTAKIRKVCGVVLIAVAFYLIWTA